MSSSTGSVGVAVLLRDLGLEFRRLRTQAKVSTGEAAALIKSTPSAITRIEAGEASAIDLLDANLMALLERYGAGERDDLVLLAHQARPSVWWTEYSDVLTEAYRRLLIREQDATLLLNYEAFLLPGLLQTSTYASAVIPPFVTKGSVDQLVALRARRQKELLDNRRQLRFVIDESVLLRNVLDDYTATREQLELLRSIMDRENVAIRILPLNSTLDMGTRPASFLILRYSGEAPDFLFVEEFGPQPQDLAVEVTTTSQFWPNKYLHRFYELEDGALTEDDSKALIDQMMAAPRDRSGSE